MDKFLHSRLFRCLVCLVLVCCILVNCSPIRAKASVVLTSQAIFALMYLAACGAVIVPTSIELANQIGKSLDDYMKITLPMDAVDLWVTLCDYHDSLVPEWDPNKPHDDLAKWLSRGLLTAIAGWCCTLIKMDGVEVENSSDSRFMTSITYERDGASYTVTNNTPFIAFGYSFYNAACTSFTYGIECYNGGTMTRWTQNGTSYTTDRFGPQSTISGTLTGNEHTEISKTLTCASIPWVHFGAVTNGTELMREYRSSYYDGTQTTTIEPDIYVGDIPGQIKNGDTDEEKLNLPPLDPSRLFPGTDPIDVQMKDTLQKLKDGTITPEQFEDMFRKPDTQEPEVTTPVETLPSVDPDPDPSEPPVTEPWVPSGMENFTLDLKKFFPFCIPFDLYAFLTCLNAEPEAPVISWQIPVPGVGNSRSGAVPLEIDLSAFDSVAQLLRRLQLLLFCVGLAFKTRDLIKG